jgi:hypothetical protein
MMGFVEQVRPISWRVLALVVVVCVVASLTINFVAGPPDSRVHQAWEAVEQMTGQLIQGPLIFGPLYFAIIGTVIFGVGRLRCADVGWRLADVGPAVLVTLGFWAAMQLGLALWTILTGGPLQWNDAWSESSDWGARRIVGALLAQLLGNALLEEMVYRGFFLPQFYLKALSRLRPATAVVLALVGSQALFAMTHIPQRLFVQNWPIDALPGDQLALFVQGLAYAAIYLVTRNLFVCVGLHALWNQPARLLPVPFAPGVQIVWYATAAMLVVAWLLADRRRNRRLASQDSQRAED